MKIRRRTGSMAAPGWVRPGQWLRKLSGGGMMRLFLATFGACFVAGYVFAAMVLFPAPFLTQDRAAPEVVGLLQDEADDLILRAGLVIGDVETITHPTLDAGRIVWQDPAPGTVVPEGTALALAVSQGGQPVPVPDVANYEAEAARLLVQSAGLVPVIDSVQTASPRGVVVNTRPATGITLRPGSTVRILVSVGPPTVTVPELTGMTLDEARDTLETLGLVMGQFVRGTFRQQPPGVIYQQTPAAGTLTAPGTRVSGRVVRER